MLWRSGTYRVNHSSINIIQEMGGGSAIITKRPNSDLTIFKTGYMVLNELVNNNLIQLLPSCIFAELDKTNNRFFVHLDAFCRIPFHCHCSEKAIHMIFDNHETYLHIERLVSFIIKKLSGILMIIFG